MSVQRSPFLSGTVIAAILVAFSPAPASAQNLFDLFFGGMRRAMAPSGSYADPRQDGRVTRLRHNSGPYVGGGGVAYCVRLCDGRYFPITYNTRNAADICNSFCPASPTKVFNGSGIDHAYSPEGKRYSDIPNAFVYRARLVKDCTCDGKSPTGLVRQDVNDDDTLRQGDLVATSKGLMAYRGESRNVAQFSPINPSSFSPAMRKQLLATRVEPNRTAEEMKGADEAAIVSRNIDQRNQAAR
ncbi:hypothetical protein CAK95_06785 [Pseudorhodoplanes sinuspersici]|uniref:DUF2865 domain-containing protein n=1 Tax=Pseudorhodoplanes sinuspersici TaxID=1235591 RepID=A0A1W6ZN38_9HYPH|nr:hypothetical protein CAK95_06785 [Pseudorhodoplanes sinuspersici]